MLVILVWDHVHVSIFNLQVTCYIIFSLLATRDAKGKPLVRAALVYIYLCNREKLISPYRGSNSSGVTKDL